MVLSDENLVSTATPDTLLKTLVEQQLVTEEQSQQALQNASDDPVSFLLENNVVTDEQVVKARGVLFDVPYIDAFDKDVELDVLNVISEELARTYRMIPFEREGNIVRIAMINPQDFKALEALSFIARKEKFTTEIFVISEAGFRHLVDQYAPFKEEVAKALEESGNQDDITEKLEDLSDNDMSSALKSAPVIKMVSVILRNAVEGKASDIHIEPVTDGTRVRYRVDGILHTSLILPKNIHRAIVARIKVMANLKIDETRVPQDGRFRITVLNRNIDCRISTLPLLDSEKVVIRILDTSQSIRTLEELGFSGVNLATIEKVSKKPHGMMLVTGPTGSGKSTTLYALLTMINQENINIITLEDPVEYYLQGVNQSQINPKAGLTFSSGLRSILRQDPDVIMVGEVRDNETAELSIHAALTGHKVFSTLHTNDSFGAIPRLIDMGIEPFLIAPALNLVVAQRLVRKVCEHCREEYSLSKDMEEKVWKDLETVSSKAMPKDIHLTRPLTFYRGKGCIHCKDTGYQGRTVIGEVLNVSSKIRNIILKKINIDALRKEFSEGGFITMRQDGVLKALQGHTSVEEVWNATKD